MAGPQWLNRVIAYAREHVRFWRATVHWQPPVRASSASLDAFATDRYGNRTVRARQEIRTLDEVDDAGRAWTILEIVAVEPAEGYERMHVVRGRARYELKDGTPVTRRDNAVFDVSGTLVRLRQD